MLKEFEYRLLQSTGDHTLEKEQPVMESVKVDPIDMKAWSSNLLNRNPLNEEKLSKPAREIIQFAIWNTVVTNQQVDSQVLFHRFRLRTK